MELGLLELLVVAGNGKSVNLKIDFTSDLGREFHANLQTTMSRKADKLAHALTGLSGLALAFIMIVLQIVRHMCLCFTKFYLI